MYPRRVVQAALDRVQDRISRRQFIGPIGGENLQRLSEASFVVTKAEIGEAGLSIEVEPIMELGRGRELAGLLESGEAAFYPVGEGIVRDGVVQDGYILLGFSVGWKDGDKRDGSKASDRS